MLIIHEVVDYDAWKKVFDAAAVIRREAGERSFQVLKYQSDANRIVHFSNWTSIDDAKRFFESPKLVQIRKEAGLKAPDFIYLEQLEAGAIRMDRQPPGVPAIRKPLRDRREQVGCKRTDRSVRMVRGQWNQHGFRFPLEWIRRRRSDAFQADGNVAVDPIATRRGIARRPFGRSIGESPDLSPRTDRHAMRDHSSGVAITSG